jgi:hypothetical protein
VESSCASAGTTTGVNGGDELISLRPVLEAPGEARRFIRATVRAPEDLVESLTLGVSELVTNAVVHARTDINVTVRQLPDAIRVEVVDFDPTLPRALHVPVDSGSGRGLSILEGMGLRWGAQPRGDGKVVWIEIPNAM